MIPGDEIKNHLKTLKGISNINDVIKFCKTPGEGQLEVPKNIRNISVEVSQDQLEAYVTFLERPMPNEVVEELNSQGITFGIDSDNISALLKRDDISALLKRDDISAQLKKKETEGFVAARGREPGQSKSGYVEWFVKIPDSSFAEDQKGNVDFYNLDLFTYVRKNDRIAKIHPPVPGRPGKTVYGKRLPSKPAKPATLRIINGFKKDSDNNVYAREDGVVILKNNLLSLDPVLRIPTDVDYKTGNIDASVNVQIGGWVRSGFHVKSKKSIYIKGGIEEKTSITAGKDLSVVLGIMGNQQTVIETAGDLKAKFIQDAEVSTGGNLYVNEYIMNTNVKCDGSVLVNGRKGAIINSQTDAGVSVVFREYKASRNRDIKVRGFNRISYLETIKGLQKKQRTLKEHLKELALKIRTMKKKNKADIQSILFDYQKSELEMQKVNEQISEIKNLLDKVEGEGMVKVLSNSNGISLKIKGKQARIDEKKAVKLYYDPDKKGVIRQWLASNG